MIALRKVDGTNIWDILKLEVSEPQKKLVASNSQSIIEAYISEHGNGYALPLGIYNDSQPVGFLMIGFDRNGFWTNAPYIASGNYYLWRFMIDRKYQNKGYGKSALKEALKYIAFPFGKAE